MIRKKNSLRFYIIRKQIIFVIGWDHLKALTSMQLLLFFLQIYIWINKKCSYSGYFYMSKSVCNLIIGLIYYEGERETL